MAAARNKGDLPVPMPIHRLVAVGLALALGSGPAAAFTTIRDAEIEQTLKRISWPLFRVAGVSPSSVDIYIVQDPQPNAFVAGRQDIFVNTGLLQELDGIDEVRAVIAHELGHVTAGHLLRRDEAVTSARGIAAIGMLGAAAATVGGSPQAGLALAVGAGQAASRDMLSHSRGDEASADQAGLGYLSAAGGDPAAMLAVLRHFRQQEALTAVMEDNSYGVSHPRWGERMTMLEERIAKLPLGKPPSEEDAYWHARMVAKLDAFIDSPAQTLRRYPPSDTSEAAQMARAIAWHRRPEPARALAAARALVEAHPDDAYYQELEGQFLLELGRAPAAADAYRRAAALAPKEPLMLAGLGRALLNSDGAAAAVEAREVLARAATLDKANGQLLHDLALAEARLGHEGAAALATAERFALEADWRDANRNAVRAADLLAEGSPGWRRAQDLIGMSRRALRKK